MNLNPMIANLHFDGNDIEESDVIACTAPRKCRRYAISRPAALVGAGGTDGMPHTVPVSFGRRTCERSVTCTALRPLQCR